MESAYLKCHVGSILAKAIADTVVAQPSNPQEYLALYLIHYLNTQEQRSTEAERLQKAIQIREQCVQRNAEKEKVAADIIRQGILRFKERLQKKRLEEKELIEIYEEATAEAEDLLEQESAYRDQNGTPGQDEGYAPDASAQGSPEEQLARLRLERRKERLDEARTDFYVAQRFMLYLQKKHFGELKNKLLDSVERVRMAKEEVETLKDIERQIEEDALRHPKPLPSAEDVKGNARMSSIASELAERLRMHRDHKRIGVDHVLYRVLRCLCYLLFNATPRATDTSAKVAGLLKPAVVVQLLRAFDPVATYDKNRPLKLEKILTHVRGDGNNEDGGEEPEAENAGETIELFPIPQPKTRQVRRVQRIMRSCFCDSEYICDADPADYFDDSTLEEEEVLVKEVTRAETAATRRKQIEEAVESQTKQRGGIVLYALMRFVRAASNYRSARDAWIAALQELSLTIPDSQEMPEEDDPDDDDTVRQDDEEPLNDDGELDYAEINRVQAKIGVDEDEALVRIWEVKDKRQQAVLQDLFQVIAKAAIEEEEEDDEEAE